MRLIMDILDFFGKNIRICFSCMLIFIILNLLFSCEPLCNNIILQEAISPDKKHKAIAFIRDCGATTSFSPQITIIDNNIKFKNKAGNIFRGNKSKFLKINWISKDLLIIFYQCKSEDIFLKKTKYKNIEIRYQKK